MQQHRFTSTTFLIWSGLLIYAVNFLFVYIFAAIACAKRLTQIHWLGLSLVPLVTTLSCGMAAVTIGVVIWMTIRRNRLQSDMTATTRFIRFVAIGGGGLSLLALLWLTLPPLLITVGCH